MAESVLVKKIGEEEICEKRQRKQKWDRELVRSTGDDQIDSFETVTDWEEQWIFDSKSWNCEFLSRFVIPRLPVLCVAVGG